MSRLNVYAQKNIITNSVDFIIRNDTDIVEPMYLVVNCNVDRDNSERVEPSLQLEMDLSRKLFQAMWDEGFRPESGHGGGAQVEAMTAHLEDMRKLVFEGR